MAVADFDGDGHEDLFLSQNFFGARTGVPRYDAGRGLVLRGDGLGSFEALEGYEAGVAVYACPIWSSLLDLEGKLPEGLQALEQGGVSGLIQRVSTPGGGAL